MAIIKTINLTGCLEPPAEAQNFDVYAGEAADLVVTVTDGYGKAVDLTGATVKWALEANPASATASISKDTTTGITITNPTAGQFTVAIAPSDTSPLQAQTYFHAATVTDATSNKSVVLTGYVGVTAMPANV